MTTSLVVTTIEVPIYGLPGSPPTEVALAEQLQTALATLVGPDTADGAASSKLVLSIHRTYRTETPS